MFSTLIVSVLGYKKIQPVLFVKKILAKNNSNSKINHNRIILDTDQCQCFDFLEILDEISIKYFNNIKFTIFYAFISIS